MYAEGRRYRAGPIQAAHQCEDLLLRGHAGLGLVLFSSTPLPDSSIEKDLGLDGLSESVLVCRGLG